MDPMTFLSRLAAQVPPPRFHVLSYFGVLAPAAARREEVVPGYDEHEDVRSRPCAAAASSSDAEAHRSVDDSNDNSIRRSHPERMLWVLGDN
jgi:hypothetical protein